MTAPAPEPLHVIAEAGTNHGGDPDVARRLIDLAAGTGADSVKFQLIYPEGLYLPAVWEDGELVDSEVFRLRSEMMLPDEAWPSLADHARQLGMPLTASVFDERGLDLLDELDAPYIKLASTDGNHLPLIRQAAQRGRKVLLSTGMCELSEIHTAVEAFTAAGGTDLVLLHCVSIYPAPIERANIGFVEVLRREFDLPVGFSDHTESSVAAIAAVALGATWIEKHLTYDRAAPGFDHAYAAEPDTFEQYVADLRAAAAAVAPHGEKVGDAERSVMARARRSLYAARDLEPGERLTVDDVLVVRPPGPLSPPDLDELLGAEVTEAVRRWEPLTRDALAPPGG